jgi:hypothetical protein
MPKWSRVLLGENLEIAAHMATKIARSSLHDASRFSERFDEIARSGVSRINIVGHGVLNDALVVSIETPRQASAPSGGHTSVLFAGPMRFIRLTEDWNLSACFEPI